MPEWITVIKTTTIFFVNYLNYYTPFFKSRKQRFCNYYKMHCIVIQQMYYNYGLITCIIYMRKHSIKPIDSDNQTLWYISSFDFIVYQYLIKHFCFVLEIKIYVQYTDNSLQVFLYVSMYRSVILEQMHFPVSLTVITLRIIHQ